MVLCRLHLPLNRPQRGLDQGRQLRGGHRRKSDAAYIVAKSRAADAAA